MTEIQFARLQHISRYVQDLRQVTGLYTGWIPEEYVDRVTAEEAHDLLWNDEQIHRSLELYSLFAAGEYYVIQSANWEIKYITEKMLQYIPDFLHTRKSLVQNGTLFGLGLQKKYWRKVVWPEYPDMVWEVPCKIKEVDRRRTRMERDITEDRNNIYYTIWDPRWDKYVKILDRDEVPDYEGPCVQDFIWYFYEEAENFPQFRGLGEVLFRLAYMKSKVIQYWGELCESWSKPYIVALIDTMKGAFDASAGTGFQNSQTRVDNLIDQWDKMVARHVMVQDKNGDDVKFFEHGSQGQNIIKEFLNYADRKEDQIILGAEIGKEESGGSYAKEQIHRGVLQSKVLYGRNRIEERYREDLLQDFYWRNRINLALLGYEIPPPGAVSIQFRVEREELQKKILREGEGQADKTQQQLMKGADTA